MLDAQVAEDESDALLWLLDGLVLPVGDGGKGRDPWLAALRI